jgi:probable rRNA maturation factor
MKPRRPTKNPTLEISVSRTARADWSPSREQFRAWSSAALPTSVLPASLSIRIVGSSTSRRLNACYRGKDRPTNVLSFAGTGVLPDGVRVLGDLVICAPVVSREAKAQGKSLRAHWAHLTVHGVLHLLGMDHALAAEAAKMEQKEQQILDRLGFSDPYA